MNARKCPWMCEETRERTSEKYEARERVKRWTLIVICCDFESGFILAKEKYWWSISVFDERTVNAREWQRVAFIYCFSLWEIFVFRETKDLNYRPGMSPSILSVVEDWITSQRAFSSRRMLITFVHIVVICLCFDLIMWKGERERERVGTARQELKHHKE